MAILAECPICHKKQSAKNKKCSCSLDLDAAKKSKKVRYWINYRMPDGKQRRESVAIFEGLNPYSIKDARDALSKRDVQKKENRLFDMLPASNITFQEMSVWYLDLKSVKKLASCDRIKVALNMFNKAFGTREVLSISLTDIENYQEDRIGQGRAPATVDMEISLVKTMVTKAFYNDKIDGRILKTFNNVKKMLKKGVNARRRTLSPLEYINLVVASPEHLRNVLVVAHNTGMRKGEIRKLRWKHVDWQNMFIRLPAEITKEGRNKTIPINHHAKSVLESIKPELGVVSDDHHDFVFTFKGEPIKSAGGLRRSLDTACKISGIKFGRDIEGGFIFHDIRRTFKTNMLAAGVQKEYRDVILGHSLEGMDAHYIVPKESDLSQAMDQYTQWIDDQVKTVLENVDHSVDQVKVDGDKERNKATVINDLEDMVLRKYRKLRNNKENFYKALILLVPPARIELAAHGLGIHCSIH